ncbi:MAG: ArsB/NhaD family transporter, partial [Synergistetes bacterium]|nr:ArsB/NhaD family transporter [Synergistota bacterium]
MSLNELISVSVFIFTLLVITLEKVRREIAALLGGGIVIALGVFPQKEAFHYIDLNTIGLLLGMMLVAGVLKETGLFEYLAIKAIKLGRGNAWAILMTLSWATAVVSALVDNVTTVLLIAPIALSIAEIMKIDPLPYLYSIVFASNIGGTATLIGDPPNIIIGSFAGLSFTDFLFNLTPIVLVIMLLLPLSIRIFFGKISIPHESWNVVSRIEETNLIKDTKFLKYKVAILLGIIVAFCFHSVMGLEAATIAVLGGMVMLIFCGKEAERIIRESVELPTLLFFAGFFIIVGALDYSGVIRRLGSAFISLVGNKQFFAANVLLWGSGFASAFIDNIPYTATMVYFVNDLIHTAHFSSAFWWVLALGACLGGNGTLIGASANIVVASIADRAGYRIRFLDFLKVGMFTMVLSLILS